MRTARGAVRTLPSRAVRDYDGDAGAHAGIFVR